MTGQASVVEVLRAHRYTWHEGPGAGFRCRCDGWTDGSLWHHQADMLAAAGLLASGPTLPVGPTRESEAEHAAMCGAYEAGRRDGLVAALREAATEVEQIDPEWDSALWVRGAASPRGGAYVPVPDWLQERAARIEAEAKGDDRG